MSSREKLPSTILPFAWLETYLAVYKHCDIPLAASECGHTVHVVNDHLQKLSIWMHRLLTAGGEWDLVLAEERPPQVATAADKALRAFDLAVAELRGEPPPNTLSLVSSFRSEITLFQLEVISGLSRGVGIDNAADQAGRTGRTGRRGLTELQKLIGCKLIDGPRFTRLTPEGKKFAASADVISKLLRGAQAEIDKGEICKARARKRQDQLVRELMLYEHFHNVISNYKRISKENLDLLVGIEARVKHLRPKLTRWRKRYGSLSQIGAFEEDLPKYYKFTRRRSACGRRIVLSSKPIKEVSSVIYQVLFDRPAPVRNKRGRFTQS